MIEPIEYKDAIDKEKYTVCAITLQTFKNDDQIIQLPCHHCFMAEPLIQWFSNGNYKCPVCRFNLQTSAASIQEEEEYIIIEYMNSNQEKKYRIFTFHIQG